MAEDFLSTMLKNSADRHKKLASSGTNAQIGHAPELEGGKTRGKKRKERVKFHVPGTAEDVLAPQSEEEIDEVISSQLVIQTLYNDSLTLIPFYNCR